MVTPEDTLSIRRQADLLGVNRSAIYYRKVVPSDEDLMVKRLIDQAYMEHPEFGSRRMRVWLCNKHGLSLNRKTVQRHMREMGIEAIYPRQNTSKPAPEDKVYPYLLKGLDVTHPNHVWSIDITYIPIRKSWLYLVAIIDWFSRYVVGWEIDDTLDIRFVLSTCKEALAYAKPEIMNSDQGSHFTSPRYVSLFLDAGSKVSMDHRGRAYDNIFIERLWRSVKYENVYLSDYSTPKEARAGIGKYLRYYNEERPHQSLRYRTPFDVYNSRG